MIRLAVLLLLLATPTFAQSRIVGGPGPGCIAGAVQLPGEGPGYRTIRRTRSWFWGHPDTVGAIQLLAHRAQAAGMAELYVNDISKPQGGPFPGIHASHMTGLDADIWLDLQPKPPSTPAQRDTVEVESLVRPDGRGVEPRLWTRQHAELIRLAAGLPGVDRLLVNAAIKQELCRTVTGDRTWLRLVRPWYGHAAHMHLHFRCPANQPECHDQAPPPPGDGCDASLAWWFEQLDAPKVASKPPPPIRLPPACSGILGRG